MSKIKVKRLLTRRLGLASPRFVLEHVGDMVMGSVISETFTGSDDFARQQSIRSALRDELNPASLRQVGMILAYTPEEWDFDVPSRAPNGRSRKGARRPAPRRTTTPRAHML